MVPELASRAECEAAYRRLVFLVHPDKFSHPAAKDAISKLSEAIMWAREPEEWAAQERERIEQQERVARAQSWMQDSLRSGHALLLLHQQEEIQRFYGFMDQVLAFRDLEAQALYDWLTRVFRFGPAYWRARRKRTRPAYYDDTNWEDPSCSSQSHKRPH